MTVWCPTMVVVTNQNVVAEYHHRVVVEIIIITSSRVHLLTKLLTIGMNEINVRVMSRRRTRTRKEASNVEPVSDVQPTPHCASMNIRDISILVPFQEVSRCFKKLVNSLHVMLVQ